MRDRDKDRDRDSETEKQTERQRQRETERDSDRERHRDREREIKTERDRDTQRQRERDYFNDKTGSNACSVCDLVANSLIASYGLRTFVRTNIRFPTELVKLAKVSKSPKASNHWCTIRELVLQTLNHPAFMVISSCSIPTWQLNSHARDSFFFFFFFFAFIS